MLTKFCNKCKTEKTIDNFYYRKDRNIYDQPCKSCRRDYYKDYRDSNREKLQDYQRQWVDDNRDKHNEYNRKRNARLKKLVMGHYGNKCVCCGETEPLFLTIDHINNDGNEHRKTIHGDKIYSHIIKENYPDTFQILCFNCNIGKHLNGGVCPHRNS